MHQAIQHDCSREAYLALEEANEVRHEFFRGEIFAMAGGTFNHAAISGNLFASLKNRLAGKPCKPMNSDMRIHTPPASTPIPISRCSAANRS